jgi:UDP-N-acetylglucosamine--N-acetylmuramyl-(pentapeptide) pyrophosphoryl-undecaprenol N-acetylglucosamine transferase
MSLRFVIACGGTGGHLFPGVAVAEELRRRGYEALLLVSKKAIDRTALEGRPDLVSRALPAVGWPGFFTPRLFAFLSSLLQTRNECRALLREYRPAAVLGMGGFTSAAPLWEARRAGIPGFLHESNAFPGRVTRLLAGQVDQVLLGFGRAADFLKGAPSAVTGTPVRGELRVVPRDEAAAVFGLDPARRTVLVIGGSQGARGLNAAVRGALPRWADRRDVWQFIHLTGEKDASGVAAAYKEHGFLAHVAPFSTNMAEAYSLADLAIARSGASSLTELSHYGLPALLVPFPAAADDHQTANAQVYTEAGAALLCPEAGLTSVILDEAVRGLLHSAERLDAMRRASSGLAVPDAASRVADLLAASAASHS